MRIAAAGCVFGLLGVPLLAMGQAGADTAPLVNPGVRIVRLSQVIGDVKMDRNVSRGYEAAFLNLPVTQGAKLKTGQGAAEVEFEDDSSLRLTPNSTIEFSQLSRNSAGGTVSSVHVVQGSVYVSLANTKSEANAFQLVSGGETISLQPASHVEFRMMGGGDSLAVYKGVAEAQVNGAAMTVGQKKTLMFDAAGHKPPVLVGRIEPSDYDEWDKKAVAYHARAVQGSAFQTAGLSGMPGYGFRDLNYYGSFSNVGGCGNMWRPYMASAAWDPYANGTWAFYQGAGYSWVSPYPWAWAPYHSGSWQYCDGVGYGWQPGGSFVGLNNTALLVKPKTGPVHVGPPARPLPGSATLVAVNDRPLVVNKITGQNTVVFQRDSAGLGVPRETFGKLNGISAQTERSGMVTRSFASPSYGSGSRSGTAASSGFSGGSVSSSPRGISAGPSSGASTSHASGGGSTGGGAHK